MTFIWRFYHLKVQNNMSQIILSSQPLSGRPLELFLYISRGDNHGRCDIHSACVKANWGLYRSECHHCLPLRGEIRQSIGTAYCYCICRNAQYKVHLYSNYSQCLFAGFSFFWKKNFSKWLGKSLFPEKRKIKSCGKKISLVFVNWLILGIGYKLPNLHKLTYWFDVLTNRNAGFYIAPPPFSKNWGFFQNLEKL